MPTVSGTPLDIVLNDTIRAKFRESTPSPTPNHKVTSTHKKVQILRFDREPASGVLNPAAFLVPQGIELLSPSGTLSVLPYREVKSVCFVKEYADAAELLRKRTFTSRPKQAGLWVRLRFRDQEELEGVLPGNVLQWDPAGFYLMPPDQHANAQRLFVPRQALADLQVLSVIGGTTRRSRTDVPAELPQLQLFDK